MAHRVCLCWYVNEWTSIRANSTEKAITQGVAKEKALVGWLLPCEVPEFLRTVWPAPGFVDTELGVSWDRRWVMERRRFTREFKLEAVRLIRDRGVSYAQASQDLECASRRSCANG